jgi:hypothetical protein
VSTTNTAVGDFSLVLGGPLYQLWRRTHLAGDALQLLHRRVIVSVLLAWAPLLLLSALPLLIVAELIVHRRMRAVVEQFLDRGLIPDAARAQFDAAVAAAMRLRNSVTAEVLLIAFVYVVGIGFVWRTQLTLDVASWYGVPAGGKLHPSPAGWWLMCVSLPLFQFLLLRWYFRIAIWTRFLWQVSRIELNLMPLHPDRCGGLGFLSTLIHAFSPLLLAQGVLLAGMIADKIFFAGAHLPDFKVEIASVVGVMVFTILAPLLVFSPGLAAAKRAGLRKYGLLAQRYAREFDHKWLRAGAPADEPLIGSADIQSLADLGNSFDVVKGMKFAPFTLHTVVQLAVATLLPVVPLMLTMMSVEELAMRLAKIVF